MASTSNHEDAKHSKAQKEETLVKETRETAHKYFSTMSLESIYDGPYDIDSFRDHFVERWQLIHTSGPNLTRGASEFHKIIRQVAKKPKWPRF